MIPVEDELSLADFERRMTKGVGMLAMLWLPTQIKAEALAYNDVANTVSILDELLQYCTARQFRTAESAVLALKHQLQKFVK